MKPKSIGILGGAGPLAGARLLERVFSLSTRLFGCCRDQDFPKVILISFPFTEMLSPVTNSTLLQKELKSGLNLLRQNGAEILAIACNTLHAFLPENEKQPGLIELPAEAACAVPAGEVPLVLCTSTSARFQVHRRFFPCCYPDVKIQERIDWFIDRILKGEDPQGIAPELRAVLEPEKAHTVVLGCTELSLIGNFSMRNKRIVDPLELAAAELVKKSFSRR